MQELHKPVSIREMQPEDAEAVARLTAQLGYERNAAEIRHWIAGLASVVERQAAFVGCLGDEVVGWIEVSLERRLQSPSFALIGGLVVSADVRSHGIGRKLCERAEAWGWEHGAARLRVTSRTTRADAHRFYLREGFELTKTSAVFEKKRP
jgi:GNAT superfamily N-acetyltransferase